MSQLELCKTSPNCFCYICGKFNLDKKEITKRHKRAYYAYFGVKIRDQKNYFVPHFLCFGCDRTLLMWMNGASGYEFKFEYPMHWRQPTDHETDCYYCLTNIVRVSQWNNFDVAYPNVSSATRPIMCKGNAFNGVWPPASMPKHIQEDIIDADDSDDESTDEGSEIENRRVREPLMVAI